MTLTDILEARIEKLKRGVGNLEILGGYDYEDSEGLVTRVELSETFDVLSRRILALERAILKMDNAVELDDSEEPTVKEVEERTPEDRRSIIDAFNTQHGTEEEQLMNHRSVDLQTAFAKSCPFCGSSRDIAYSLDRVDERFELTLTCQNCGAHFTISLSDDPDDRQLAYELERAKDELMRRWNSRETDHKGGRNTYVKSRLRHTED